MSRQENPRLPDVIAERHIAELISHGPARMASLGLNFQSMTERQWESSVKGEEFRYKKETLLESSGQTIRTQVISNDRQTFIRKTKLDPAGLPLETIEIRETYSPTGNPEGFSLVLIDDKGQIILSWNEKGQVIPNQWTFQSTKGITFSLDVVEEQETVLTALDKWQIPRLPLVSNSYTIDSGMSIENIIRGTHTRPEVFFDPYAIFPRLNINLLITRSAHDEDLGIYWAE